MLRRITTSTFLYASSSTAISLYLPSVLASSGLIHFPTTVSATLLATSLCLVTPVGFARGVLNGAETTLVPAAGNAVATQLEQQNLKQLDQSTKEILQDTPASLLSASGGGTAARMMLGLFLPSTEVLLEHIAVETSKKNGDHFVNLTRGATNGLIAGQITNVRDKCTLVGLGLAAVAVVATVAVDQAAGKVKQTKDEVVASVQENTDQAMATVKKSRDRVVDGLNANSVPEKFSKVKDSILSWSKESDSDDSHQNDEGSNPKKI